MDDSQDYELSLSRQEAEQITSNIGIVGNLAVLAYKDDFYPQAFSTADGNDFSAQMETRFAEPISFEPISIAAEESLNYTF